MKLLPRMLLLLRSELEVFGSASFRPHLCRNVLCQRNVVSLVARLRLLLELQSMTIDPDVSQCMTKISGMSKKIVPRSKADPSRRRPEAHKRVWLRCSVWVLVQQTDDAGGCPPSYAEDQLLDCSRHHRSHCIPVRALHVLSVVCNRGYFERSEHNYSRRFTEELAGPVCFAQHEMCQLLSPDRL